MKVSEVLELQGIPVSSADEISPGLNEEATDGMTINIGRITSKTVTKYEKVAHKIKKIKDHDMRSALGNFLIPTEKFEFKEPVLYEFINSDFDRFEDFLDVIRDD